MKKLILFLTTCLALIWSADVRATHLMGADLTYAIVGPHQYIVTLSVYRDCNSNVVQPTSYRIFYQSVACNDTGSFVVSVASGYPVNATDTCPSQHSTCDGGTVYGVQQWVYTSSVVNLPAGCSDVVLSWASGNRNAVISNLTNPLNDAMYISAEVNTSLIDNSPKFLNPLTVDLCLGQLNYINQGGYDANGDSLVYVLDTAQGTTGGGGGPVGYPYYPTALNYTPGYTPTLPITSSTFNFDPHTGEITVFPTQTEYDIVKLIVYEYRNGVIIGHVERDMQIQVNLCTDTIPTISGIGSPTATDTVFTIAACSSNCFTVYSSSADTSKTLTLTVTGQNSFPGATFTISPGNQPTLTFCWAPTRANAGSHTFYVTVKDNNCPQPGKNTQGYTVIVPQINPAGQDDTICQYNVAYTLGTDTAAGSWQAMSTNPITTNIVSPALPSTLITGFSLPGKYNYIWTRNSGGCGDTMSVYVTSKPYAGPDQNVCEYGVATMAATGSGRWHALGTNPTATNITDTTSATTTITGFTSLGTYSYVWTSIGCSDTVNITSVAKPNGGPDQIVCSSTGSVSMAATSGIGPWRAYSGNPAPTVITDTNSRTTTITGLTTAGTYTYFWGTGCVDTVLINVNSQPNGGPNKIICQYNTVTMGAQGVGTWSALPSNPAVTTIVSPTNDSTVITGFTSAGTYDFFWSTGIGCLAVVTVDVTPKPNAGPDQSVCQFSPATMAATGNGTWTALPTNPSPAVIATPTSPTTVINKLDSSGTYKFIWTSNGCSDTADVTVKTKPYAGPDETLCQYVSIPLDAQLIPFIGTSLWTNASGNPATITFANNTQPTTFATGFTNPGAYTLIWTEGGCSDSVVITVTPKPNAGPDQTICQYNTATMAATGTGVWTIGAANPAPTVVVNPSSATTFITGFTVSGTYSYIWSINGCPDTVKVFVTTKPNAGPDQTICQYTSATLGATGTGSWTSLPTNPALTVIVTPASPSTTVTGFTAAGTYGYVWTSNGCTDTANVIVTVKPNAGPDQTVCQFTAATMAATGVGIWSSLSTNPVPTVIVTPSSGSTQITGFSLAGTYSYVWTSNGCTDTVNVTVTAKPNAGPDQTTCQFSTAIMAATGIGTWSSLPGNPSPTVIVTPASPTTTITGFSVAGTYSYIWTSNGCTDTANVIVTPKPNAGPDQTICQYNSTNMAATGNGTWTVPGGNPAVITVANSASPTTLVSGFTASGAYVLIWTVNGCSDSVIVNVTAKPNAGPDQTTCQFSTVTMAATGTGTWSALGTNPSATVIVTPTSPTTVIRGFTVAGTYSFIWTSNGCTDTANVIVTAKPNAGPDQTICQYSTATMAAAGTGTWSAIGTNPAPTVIATPGSATTTITGFTVVGTYSYVWTSNGCTDTANVIVTAKPNAGPDQTTCQFSTATMAATGTGTWTAIGTNPAPTVIVTPASPTTIIRGFTIAGTYSYVWTGTGGCTDTAYVIVTPKPNAGIDQVFCLPGTTTLDAVGGPGVWSAWANNPGTSNIVSPSSDTTVVNGFTISGLYNYIWTVNGCTDTMAVNVIPYNPAGPDQTICQYNTMTTGASGTGTWLALSGNPTPTVIIDPTADTTTITGFNAPGIYGFIWSINPCPDTMFVTVTAKPDAGPDQTICQYNSIIMAATGTGTWTVSGSNPALVTITNNTDPATTVTGFTAAGTYTFYWSENGCSDTVLIIVTAKPNAGPDQTICQYSTTAMSATGTGTWTADAGNPAVLTFTNATSPTTSVSGFTVAGTYTLYWSKNGCSDTVLINVTSKPDAGPDQTICQYNSIIMAATGTGTWTVSGSNPALVTITNNTDPATTVTGFTAAGTYTFYWSENGCSDTVLIIVTAKPNAGPDQTICQYSTTAMSATGTGTWTADAGNPAVLTFTNATSPTTSVSGFTVAGTYTLYWSKNGCSDTVLINVTSKPDAGPDQTICQYNSIIMAATGTGTWAVSGSNPAVVSITNNTDPATTVTGFTAAGTYTFYWSLNGCSDTVLIIVTAKPNAGPDQTICQYSTTAMSASGTGTWTADAGNPAVITFTNATSPTTSVSGFTVAGTYTLYWSKNGCSDTVLINVTSKPDAGPDQTICQYNSITMAATGTGTWTASGSNPAVVSITNDTDPATTVTGFATAGTYSFYWSENGCSDTVLINVTAKPNAGTDQTICQYNMTNMAATGSGTWTADAGNPVLVTITNATDPTTSVSGFNTPGTYTFYWSLNGCTDTVLINVTIKPDAGPDQSICLPGTITMAASAGAGLWTALPSNPATTTIVTPNDPNTVISGFTAGGTYSYVWTVNGCTDTMSVYIVPLSPAGPDQTACQYSSITTAAFGAGTWSADAGNPNPTVITDPSSATTTISGFDVPGVYNFIWSVNGCIDTMSVTVIAKPDAGPDQTICQYSSTTMSATGTGAWTADAGNPAVVTFANSGDPATSVSGFTASGTYTLYWSLNGCSDTVLINVTAKPNAGPDQTICQYSFTNMAATGTGTWTADAGNPAVVTITNTSDPSTSISGFNTAGTYTFYWSLNGCTDTVLINVTAKPDAGPDQTICQYSFTNMNATGTGTWTAYAGNPAIVTFANNGDPATSISGFTASGAYTLYWSLNGCSDTVLVNVTAKPNAGPDQTICQYSSTNMAATGTGTWAADAGNPAVVTITNTTDPATTISGFNTGGIYTFYWSLNGCTDTVLINVTAKPDAGPDQAICQGSTATMAATGTGTWTADAGNPAAVTFTNATDPAATVSGFSAPGTYNLYWSLNGCSDTMIIMVSQSSTLTVSNGAVCLGQNDTLTAVVSVPGGTFLWSPGGETTQTIIVSPASTSTFTVTYTIAVCGTYTDSAKVTVYPTMTLTVQNDTICTGSSATLTTIPSTPGGSYLWSPGGQNTPSITVSPTSNTTYTVTYSLAGCPVTSVADTVDVTIPPTVTVNNGTICLGDSVTLTATPSQAGGTYTWSPGGQTTQSITVSPASTATYTVAYAIPLSVCPPTTQTATVTVTPQPTVTVSSATICDGQSATITATPTPAGGTYIWSPGGNTTSSITVSPSTTSTYSVTYTIAGCGSASGTGVVTVNPTPVVAALTPQPITCFGYTNGSLTPVITPASGTYTYAWSNSETGAIDTGLAQGSYTLTITDQNGCTASSTVPGVIAAAPAEGIAEIMPSDITVFQDSMIQLTTTFSYPASSITSYSWTPTTGLSCINCPNPIVNTTYATDTLINYTVTITYNNGCISNAMDTIHILSAVAFPDAFTPNGDGRNDIFTILAKGVKDYRMTIYNRWGELVFETNDLTVGWDGNYKGAQQPSGVYEYFVAITYLNGQSLAKTGNVTLLR